MSPFDDSSSGTRRAVTTAVAQSPSRGRRPKVLLVKAPCYSDSLSPPLGIGYLAAHIRDVATVRVVDSTLGPADIEGFADVVREMEPDLVGFSVVTYAATTSLKWMRVVKSLCPKAVTMAGGPHPAALPKEYLAQCGDALDYVMTGECEFTFRQLVAMMAAGESLTADRAAIAATVPGAVVRVRSLEDGGDAFVHSHASNAEDIDDYGMPAWDLMEPRLYPHAPHGAFARRFPVAPIITSRGCPYACGFCTVPYLVGRKMRYRSARLIADELRLLKGRYGIREFQIVDDNFTIRKQHTLDVCDEIIRHNLIMPWSTPNGVRVDALDDDVLDAMKAAGCYSISLGIESGSPAVLKRMVKHLDLDIVPDTVERIRKRGMEVNAFFILGYPGETPDEAEMTLRYARSLALTRANFSAFTPLPGTPEFDALSPAEKDNITSDASFFGAVKYVSPAYTREDLKNLQRRGLIRFYGRPQQAARLVRAIRSPQTAYYIARRALTWFGG